MTFAFRALALASVLAATAVMCPADVTKLAATDRAQLLKASDAVLVTTMREIPSEVVTACAAACSGRDFHLADPGQPFQATDVIIGQKLPSKRLIWAARLPGYMVVHFERGGIVHVMHVMVVALEAPRKAHVVWTSMTKKPLTSYADFRAELIAGRLDDSIDYSP